MTSRIVRTTTKPVTDPTTTVDSLTDQTGISQVTLPPDFSKDWVLPPSLMAVAAVPGHLGLHNIKTLTKDLDIVETKKDKDSLEVVEVTRESEETPETDDTGKKVETEKLEETKETMETK